MKILLNNQKSKKSTNVNNSLPIALSGGKRLLPMEDVLANIDEVELYHKERKSSDIVRLTCTINPLCTNVLHNVMTEIVRNEGTDNVEVLNYSGLTSDDVTIVGKNKTYFTGVTSAENAIRDTQLSNEVNEFKYHCGTNIFNNHMLRSQTFKAVTQQGQLKDEFNTLGDFLRTSDGEQKKGFSDRRRASQNGDIKLHLYLNEEVLSFKECIQEKLIEEKGWFGFTNVGKMPTYSGGSDTTEMEEIDISKVINYRKPCDFVDMYPERDLFYFTPKYNKSRKRIEKNWLYCLTYPSSSTTEGIDFIREGTNSLKVIYFDDYSPNMNGTSGVKMYSICKHGLKVGDRVNVYIGDELRLRNAEVKDIIDEYVFNIFNEGLKFSSSWGELTKEEIVSGQATINGSTYTINSERTLLTSGDKKYYLVDHKKYNYDDATQDVSYKRVINGEECEYYVRVFSRIPNWRFVDRDPSEYEMYKPNSDLIEKYQTSEFEFENHIGKMAFAKNIYNDDITQIVFTDNIDIHGLKDNLKRPLSDIFFTIIKNNEGYREWYGKNGLNLDPSSEKVEYSHAFGKLNCAFRLSKESLVNKDLMNVTALNNIMNRQGLNMNVLNDRSKLSSVSVDEIILLPLGDYKGDLHFNGDLCCYSPSLMMEESIQYVENRFNTAQRELVGSDTACDYFDNLVYDEIVSDDYDEYGFEISSTTISNVHQKAEGYSYIPHYKIPIKTVSSVLTQQKPQMLTVKNIIQKSGSTYEFCCMEKHFAELRDIMYIKHMIRNTNGVLSDFEYVRCIVTNILDYKRFECEIDSTTALGDLDHKNYKLIKIDEEFPSYSRLATNGSSLFMWRDIIPNGYDENSDIEHYPFANGAFYINKTINFFLQRQDPKGEAQFGLMGEGFLQDHESKQMGEIKTNKFINEEEITC